MNWLLFITLGAGCGWISARSSGEKAVGGPMIAGAVVAVVLGALVTFVFSFLVLLAKAICVVIGVLVVLALFKGGKSD
jgi:hypothetical protein